MGKFRNIFGQLNRIKKRAWVMIGLTALIFSISAVLLTRKSPSKAAAPNLNSAPVFAPEPRPSPKTTKEKSKRKSNNLINEKSPYLLQHAYNPVNWYPWGEKAFRKARKENKPIFLSIGYATCHWCHVMEKESFSKPAVAAIMNKHFVSIKVDREERPDVDKIYMSAARQGGWGGGWPLSMWLTPDLQPFYGGTYFPPAPRWGRPGFPQILRQLGEQWRKDPDELVGKARQIVKKLEAALKVEGRNSKLDSVWFGKGFDVFNRSFISDKGGFSRRPKFPMPINQNFLLRYYARTGDKSALTMVHLTLREMAKGGIYDHVGGGFHRYATDSEWRVPHFEKMLYDNAQLTVNFLETYQATQDKDLARVARETLDYVLRDMTDREGGFYSAEDADSLPQELAAQGFSNEGHEHKAEGAFYLWEEPEIVKILGKSQGEIFNFRYGVRPKGNAPQDPHGEFVNKNILYAKQSIKETAQQFGKSEKSVISLLEKAKDKLLQVRSKRPRSGLDDKVLTSWNGLMISALAKGSQVLEEPRYFAAAEKAARFLQSNLYDSKSKRLVHRWREGDKAIEGMADDYAFLVQGLLDLFEASSDPAWLNWAIDLTETQIRLFYDQGKGGFYMTSKKHDKNLLARVMVDSDNVEPSASSVAALNLLRLSQFTDRDDFRQTAVETMERFGAQMDRNPRSFPQMLVAVDFALSKSRQIFIAGKLGSADTEKMLRLVHARFIPNKILMVIEKGKNQDALSGRLPFLKAMVPIKNKATAYVCINYSCKLPTNDLKTLSLLLDGKNPIGG